MPPPENRQRDAIIGPDTGPEPPFPIRLSGPVVRGFGRGSRELGIPTANIPIAGLSVGGHSDLASGVYFGWVGLDLSTAQTDTTPNSSKKDAQSTPNTTISDESPKAKDAPPKPSINPTISRAQSAAALTLSRPASPTPFSTSTTSTKTPNPAPTSSTAASSVPEHTYPAVLSVGYNPFYANTHRSVEIHIMHTFAQDFYHATLKLSILGFIRPEYDYVDLESLVQDIREDIEVAGRSLGREVWRGYRAEGWLVDFGGEGEK